MKASLRVFATFCIGGTIGFIVDAGVLQLLVTGLGWDRYSGRLISFVTAATVTWLFNRTFTFHGPRQHALVAEWARYLLAMSGGFICNFAAYSALVYFFNIDRQWLILAVGAGSIAGLGVNFAASRYWVYRHHPHPAPAADDGKKTPRS
ncbi:MAG: GtrA family protein [Rudaea sp.]|nr:GtrA family protein [Rudaea sp.]